MSTSALYLVPNLLGLVAPAAVLPAGTIDVARRLRHFVVENAKPARQFLKALDMGVPLSTLHIETLPEQPSEAACNALLAPVRDGFDVGLLSDAGCPAVADPGAVLVAAAHRQGVRVVPLVGPSSLLLGLMASGLNGQAFCFHGYLPVDADKRARRLHSLEDDMARAATTHLFIETPYRTQALLAALVATCRPATHLCIAVDLTLATEWIRCAPVAAWKREPLPELSKRPALFLLGRPPP